MFQAISYVGPARAKSERYYRYQELAVDEIDPRGENLAMFLNSLSVNNLNNFSLWLATQIHHKVVLGRHRGHISLMLQEDGAEYDFNLADMGYGFSQVLPVFAEIWSSLRQSKRNTQARRFNIPSRLVVMEQPELHLHPAYQALIANTVVGALQSARDSDEIGRLQFVIETHSESIVNRIGELIARKEIKAEDVAIYVFEKKTGDLKTNISTASYDGEGSLHNWPFGFFSSTRL